MKRAKRENDKVREKQNKISNEKQEEVKKVKEDVKEDAKEEITFNNLLNYKSNISKSQSQNQIEEVNIPNIIQNNTSSIELETGFENSNTQRRELEGTMGSFVRGSLEGTMGSFVRGSLEGTMGSFVRGSLEGLKPSLSQLYDIYIVSINLLSNENYLNYICHSASNHLQPHISGESKKQQKINKLNKIKNFHTGPSQICRLTDKFNIFKIKWNRVILDEAHEKLTPVVKLFSTSVKKYISGSSGVRIHLEDQYLFENLCVINSNYKWAMTGTPAQNGIDNIMGIVEFLTKKNYEEPLFKKIEKIRYLSDIVGIT